MIAAPREKTVTHDPWQDDRHEPDQLPRHSKLGSQVGAGFQFEFHCGNCSRTWKGPFEPYRRGQFAGLIYKLSYFLGDRGSMFRASNALADVGANRARESALQQSIALAEQRYTECPECAKAVCEECWDSRAQLCTACAGKGARSTTEDGDARAGTRGQAAAARDSGGPTCPNCASRIGGGRFCPECGFDMASTHKTARVAGRCARATRFCGLRHGF